MGFIPRKTPLAVAALWTFAAYVGIAGIHRAGDIRLVSPRDAAAPGTTFAFEATIVHPDETSSHNRRTIFVSDESGHAVLQNYIAGTNFLFRAGDRVHASGVVIGEYGGIYAHCTNMTLVSHGKQPSAVRTTIGELLSGKYDGKLVTVRGEVTDAFPDDIDKAYIYLILSEGDRSIYAPISYKDASPSDAEAMIGSTVEATGVFTTGQNVGRRRCIGHMLMSEGRWPVQPLCSTRKDPFDAPELATTCDMEPDKVFTLGRRRVIGTVLASWHGDRALVKTDDGNVVRLDIASPDTPLPGLRIEAVGLPESDLYNVNLRRVRWRQAAGVPLKAEPPERVAAESLLGYDRGLRKTGFHGRAVKIKGIVRGLPSSKGDGRAILEDGGFLLSVDFSNCHEVLQDTTVGCTVEVDGIAVIEVDNWRPSAIFPQIKEVFVVVTAQDALTVLKRPSWWTAGRSMTAIGLLLTIILGVTIWNRSLKSLAERRGRELTEETVSRVASELKVRERTRLAVELHDSIAQNLTGAIMEIRTGVRLGSANHGGMIDHLEMAQKTLESCRHELRNCIWDLRNRALEQTDMDKAIRLTVTPQIGSASLAVRFAVPRERISDNSAHAILRIIRELAVNAVRHGRATAIKVAGSVENGKLMFAVSDNGCGFDPSSAPGVEDGHFGLQGIRERVAALDGEMSVDSEPGRGAKITISIKCPSPP